MYVFQLHDDRQINHITTGSLRMVVYTKELHFLNLKNGLVTESLMTTRVTEQRRLRELHPAGSLASPASVSRKRTSYLINYLFDIRIVFK